MASQPIAPGAKIGKYEVLARVAVGGMGTVYKAMDSSLGRVVALKVIAGRLIENTSARERFRREARNAARLNHPNIVTLYECGKFKGSYFLAMEFIEGQDLGDYILSRGKLDAEETRAILIQAVQALDHAYRQGIVHRDIKPSNFLLARQNGELVVKMTDLGLSRTVSEDEYRVTRDGSTVGTVDYLSPEQSRDSRLADIRSDIYSLGCTAYHMLAGEPPFSEGGLGERVYKHLHTEPTDVRKHNPDVPPGLWAVLKRMLAKAPGTRYQKPAALLHDLLHLPRGASDEPREPQDSSSRRLADRREVAPPASERREAPLAGGDDDSASNFSTPDQRVAAARQFERAREVLADDDTEYGRALMLSCCQLDPANLQYRQALRQIKRKPGRTLARLAAPLNKLAAKTRLGMAMRKREYLKALEFGEEVIAHAPKDIHTHVRMSEAAEALGLPRLAVWLVEQARAQDPRNPAPLRALARIHERQGQYGQALRLWDQVHQDHPRDHEAQQKINDLAAQETIERGNYQGRLNRNSRGRGKPPTDF